MTNEIYPNEKIPRLSGSMKTKTVSMFPIFLQQGCNLVNPTSVCRSWCWLRPGSWPSRLLRTSKTSPRSWPSPVSMEAHRTTLRVSLKKTFFSFVFFLFSINNTYSPSSLQSILFATASISWLEPRVVSRTTSRTTNLTWPNSNTLFWMKWTKC